MSSCSETNNLYGTSLIMPYQQSYEMFTSSFSEWDSDSNCIVEVALRALQCFVSLICMAITAPFALTGYIFQWVHSCFLPDLFANNVRKNNLGEAVEPSVTEGPSLTKPKDNQVDPYWASLPQDFVYQAWEEQVMRGFRKVESDPYNQDVDYEKYSFLLFQIVKNLPVTAQSLVKISGKTEYILFKNDHHSNISIQALVQFRKVNTFRKYAQEGYIRPANISRRELGHVPFQKVFFPLVIEQGIPHAILVVVELYPEDELRADISVIDPLGANNSYSPFAEAFVQGLRSIYSSPSTREVFNQVCQQRDLACGYHQLFNMRHLLSIGSVYKHIKERRLPPRSFREIKKEIDKIMTMEKA